MRFWKNHIVFADFYVQGSNGFSTGKTYNFYQSIANLIGLDRTPIRECDAHFLTPLWRVPFAPLDVWKRYKFNL